MRGYRIELGEIEAVLAGHPDVTECAVIAREDIVGDKRLVAYLVTDQPATEHFRTHLKRHLPDYMVPAHFIPLPKLPLTVNGKLDRKALPAPDLEASDARTQHVAPNTPTESRIAAVWADALGIASPGVDDNFFDIGGHSLKAAQIVTTLRSTLECRRSDAAPVRAAHDRRPGKYRGHHGCFGRRPGTRRRECARGGRDLTMTTAEFLSSLRERGVRLSVADGRLKCDAPPGVLDDGLQAQLAARKQELLALIAEAEMSLGAPRSLVPLKPTGDHPPLFARPGHNGDVFCYRALAAHLDPRQPLYGVEPKGVDGSPTPETVEEIAEYEVAQIRRFQPEGPYYIAGFCAGGTIAFESARQLAHAGEDVARVFLFGSPFPTVYRTGRAEAPHGAAASARAPLPRVSNTSAAARLRAWPRQVSASIRLSANRRRIEDATLAAVKRYEPGFYAGRVDVFLPSEAWRRSGDRPDEWKRVAGQVVEHVGPDGCDGDDMLREPHVPVLAALLNQAFRDEEGQHATG